MKTLIAILAVCVAAATPAFAGGVLKPKDTPTSNWQEFATTLHTVEVQREQEEAKCITEAEQYVANHPQLVNRDKVWGDRADLCLRVSGWFGLSDNPDSNVVLTVAYRRMREMWVAQGKSQADLTWFDAYVAYLFSNGNKH
jgi:hypothetical protein